MLDRAAFAQALALTGAQVPVTELNDTHEEGIGFIMAAGADLGQSQLAHCLAEAFFETAFTFLPVRETLAPTDEAAVEALERAWRAGQLTWVRTPYWRKDETGKCWFGRGYVQLTHKANYEALSSLIGIDITSVPSMAMIPEVAAKILVEGCRTGAFTGAKLADFEGMSYDHAAARSIVNGDALIHGPQIAAYAVAFEAALEAVSYHPQAQVA